MQILGKKELREINGGGIGVGIVIVGCLLVGALGFYNGKKDTDLKYDDKE